MKFILTILLTFTVYSQDYFGSLKGTVTEYGVKTPLIGVNVSINSLKIGAVTDLNGKFEITNIPVGTYIVSFQYLGYKSYNQTDLVIRSGRKVNLNIELHEDLYSADIVEVSSSYFKKSEDKQVSSVSFSSEELRRAPGSGGEISRVLSVMPSITSLGESSQDIMVRGGSALENGFYIDNIPVPALNHFQGLDGTSNGPTGIINSDLIENVDFYTGGFNSSFGDKMSSIVDIKYREANRDAFDTQLDFNIIGFGGNIEGPISKNGSFIVSGRRSYLDIIADQIDEGSGAPSYSDFQTKFVYDISDADKLVLLGIIGSSQVDQKIDKVIENEENEVGYIDNSQNTIGLNWMRSFSTQFFMNNSISYSTFDSRLRAHYSGLDNIHQKNELRAKFNLDNSFFHFRNKSFYELNASNKFEFGFEYKLEKSNYSYLIKERTNYANEVSPELNIDTELSGAKSSLFFSYIAKLNQSIAATIGLRADQNSYNEDLYLSPRLTVNYRLNADISANFSYGTYYQTIPNYYLSQNNNNKSLKDTKSTHYIFGLDYILTEDSKLTLELYHKEYENAPIGLGNNPAYLFDQKGGFPVGKLTDQGEARSSGLELVYQKKLTDNFYSTISSSYFISRYKDQNEVWRNRAFDSRFTFNAIAGYKLNKKWEFSFRWQYQGGLPTTPVDIAESRRTGETVLNTAKLNENRLDANHSLYLRVDRRYQFDRSNLIFYLSIWNTYGNNNVLAKYWNPVKSKVDEHTSLGMLPILGIEYEF